MMDRITIKYWQELPDLVGKLKSASSPLVYEWQKYFNPARSYTTSIDFEDVRINFEGNYWRVATRIYQLFCQEYQVRLNLNTFMWLATHTIIINNSLLGDTEFNEYIKENNGYEEVEEFVEHNKLVNWHGEDFELHYNQRDMEMINRLGMEIVPNRYQYRSKGGYYLPIDIHIKYNSVITNWLRRVGDGRFNYQLVHSPRLTIQGVKKGSIMALAYDLYKYEGLSELMIQCVDEPTKTEYEITIQGTRLTVQDGWAEDNKEYVDSARRLTGISDYQLEYFKVQDILRHSKYTKDGIELEEGYYQRLNIALVDIKGDKQHIYGNKYSESTVALGSGNPISVLYNNIRVKTPYESVESGEYREVLLPMVNDTSYTVWEEDSAEIDADNHIVLRIQPKEEDKREISLDELVTVDLGERYTLDRYPRIDAKVENTTLKELLPTLYPLEDTHKDIKRLTYTRDDFKYVPYILSVEDEGDRIRVIYMDNTELTIRKDDNNLRTRVVFQDRVGIELRPISENLTNVLLSLATDEIEEFTVDLVSEIEGTGILTRDLIDEWLQALVTGDGEALYRHIKGYSIGVTEDKKELEEDFDIFEDIGLI